MMGSVNEVPIFSDEVREYHLSLFEAPRQAQGNEESSPVMTSGALQSITQAGKMQNMTQYGLLARISGQELSQTADHSSDPRVFFNVSPPSSTFICGSQGSGKSHTLSCILENCLISSKAGRLPSPLTGIIFHYDTFISDRMGSPCEAAFLSTNEQIEVRVLCAPTNLRTIQASISTDSYTYLVLTE